NTNALPAQHTARALEVISHPAVPLAQGYIPINRKKDREVIAPNLFQIIPSCSSIRRTTSKTTPSIPRCQAATATVLPHKRRTNAISLQRSHITGGGLLPRIHTSRGGEQYRNTPECP